MPIQELYNFRKKYPQYDDLSDEDIVNRLTQKYPEAYSNLPEKLSQANQAEQQTRQESIPQMLGRNIKEAAASTYREGIAPIVSGASTFALGIPRKVARERGVEHIIYPEQKTTEGKILRGGAETVGLFRGIAVKGAGLAIKGAERILPRLASKGLLKTSTKGAVGAGTYGLLQQPPEGKSRIKQSVELAQFGALAPVLGAGFAKTGEFTNKAGRWIAKEFGGITDATVSIIKRLGSNRVFEPLKAQADYIGRVIVPRVKNRVYDVLSNVGKKIDIILSKLKWSPDDIKELKQVNPETIKMVLKNGGNDAISMSNAIQSNKSVASQAFKEVIERHEGFLDIKNTFYKLKNTLIHNGWMDIKGNEIARSGIPNKTRMNLVKLHNFLNQHLIGEGKVRVTGQVDKKTYFNILDDLEASISGNPKFDRHIFDLQKSLRNEVSSQVKGLDKVNKMYADSERLLGLEKKLSELNNLTKWERELQSAKSPEKFQVSERLKSIIGDDLYDDLQAHFANQDFELVTNIPGAGGGSTFYKGQFIRKGIAGATKKYYKDILPKKEQLKSSLIRGGKRLIGAIP